MKILVNHLTRMSGSNICVAGLAEQPHGGHIRPQPAIGSLTRRDLAEAGVFALGAVVELGTVRRKPSAPEVEDVSYDRTAARVISKLEGRDFWSTIERRASNSLGEVFGPALVRRGNTAAVPVGEGTSSLGVLRPQGPISVSWPSTGCD